MATFKELAPTIEGVGFTKTQVTNYFSQIPSKPEQQPKPTITKAKVKALADIYFFEGGLKKSGGLKEVASEVGLTTGQAKGLVKEFSALYSDYQSQE